MADQFSAVGTRVPRGDGPDKATGKALFGADSRPPQLLHGRILRSPHPHARILHIDTSQAKRLVGVKAVVTAADTAKKGYGPYRQDKFPLAVDKVRYLGDEVAAIAATDEELAEEALNLIKVDYEALPPVFDPLEAMKPGAPLIHDGESNIVHQFHVERGNVEQGFTQAAVVLEQTFSTPSSHQCYLEPLCCLASTDSSHRLNIFGPFKCIFDIREGLAKVLGIEEARIRAVQAHTGGGFGSKGPEMLSFYAAAALLAVKAGRPVLLENSRDMEFMAGRPRVPATIKLKMGLTREGMISAKQAYIVADCGAYTGLAPRIMETMSRRPDCMYRLVNVKNDAYCVCTNKTPTGAYRGFGNPQKNFAMESLLDMAAEKLGLDPAEVRLKNATQKGDVTVHGWQIGSCGLSECIRKAMERADWKGRRSKREPNCGLGISCMIHVSGRRQSPAFFGSRAMVKLTEDGKLNVISGEGEEGQGWHTVAALIAAEEMGIPLSDVKVIMPDTDIAPFCYGPFSDRTTLLGGNAVKLAAQDAKNQALKWAAQMLEAEPKDLEINQGNIFVRGVPAKVVTLAGVAKYVLAKRDGQFIWGNGTYDPPSEFPDPKTIYGNVSTSYTFAAQVAEVEVDPETGNVSIVNFVGAHDLGRAINPLGAEGQIEGATSQGIGFGIMEEIIFEEGTVLNPNFTDYRLPTTLDMPAIQPILIETIDPFGPFGAKGVAEPGLVPVAPAIANAIYDAVGVRITSLPITPEKILRALEEKKAKRG